MEQFFTFIGNHPYLVGIFVLLLIVTIRNELSRGGPTVGTQELTRLVNSENAVVLDVRETTEFKQGHIVGALNIPHEALADRLNELKKYSDRKLIIACNMGQHSASAGTMLRKNGFDNVSRLSGGITEWRGQNLPLVKS